MCSVVQVFQNADMAKGALDNGLGCRMTVLLKQMLFERTRVDADANRERPLLLAGAHDFGDFVLPADVAGIDPEPVHALFHRFKRQTIIEMDVGHQRKFRSLSDFADGAWQHPRPGPQDARSRTPPGSSFLIWSSVAFGSRVSVLHMDWTTTGAPPPIFTEPRVICRVFLREISMN